MLPGPGQGPGRAQAPGLGPRGPLQRQFSVERLGPSIPPGTSPARPPSGSPSFLFVV